MSRLPEADRTLELDPEQMRDLLRTVTERIVAHVASLSEQPTDTVGPDMEAARERARSLREPMPEKGTDTGLILDQLFAEIVPLSYNTASPGYLAYIPGGGVFHAAVGDLIAGAVNRYVGVWRAAPALAQLETNVLRWFADLVGYPDEARGVLTTGGSVATLNVMIAARRIRLGEDFAGATIYVSDQTHHCVEKAAALAGFRASHVRTIPSDRECRIDIAALEAAIDEDQRRGCRPFMLVASAGTTNTGAIDPLPRLADLATTHGLWLHVDAAYGGFFLLTERGRAKLRGIERADSVVLDPHKGLFMPYGSGAFLVRDGRPLRNAFSATSSYMPPFQDDPDFVDYCEISPELSRDVRGLRIWLPFKMHGAGPFRRNLDEKLDLTLWVTDALRRIEHMVIEAEPQLSIVAFRLAPPGLGPEAADELNRDFLARVNAEQRVVLTPTVLRGRFVIRICVLSFRTHADRMTEAVEIIEEAAAEVLGRRP